MYSKHWQSSTTYQSRGKRTGWSGFGRTNNRVENWKFCTHKIFLFILFIYWPDLAGIIMEPVIFSVFFLERRRFGRHKCVPLWFDVHCIVWRAGSHQHSMGGREPLGARGVRWSLQRPSTWRRDYHDGNHRCVLQVKATSEQVSRTMLGPYDGAGNISGLRTGVAKLIFELESRTV